MDKIDQLVEILLDKKASIAERDDVAMDLGVFDDDLALKALISIATNLNEDDMIVDFCGESIGEIWVKRNKSDFKILKRFHPVAFRATRDYIKAKKPEWLVFL